MLRAVVVLNVVLGLLYLATSGQPSLAQWELEHERKVAEVVLLAWFAASLGFLGVAALTRRPRIALGFLASYLVFAVHSTSLPMHVTNDHDRLKAVADNVRAVALGLESWALDHQDAFPPPDAWPTVLRADDAIPRDRWPVNPFAKAARPQAEALVPGRDAPKLPRAADVARGALLPAPYTPLGPGRFPKDGRYDAATYGALLYDYDPATKVYLVVGLTRYDRQAVVAAAQTNHPGAETAPRPPGVDAPPLPYGTRPLAIARR